MIVAAAINGILEAWDGSDTDIKPVAGAVVVTAKQEVVAGGISIPVVMHHLLRH